MRKDESLAGNGPARTPGSAPLPVIERKKDDGTVEKVIVVDPESVRQQVAGIVRSQDLSRYIL